MPKRILTAAAAVLLLLGLPFVAKAAGDPLLYAVQEALLDEGYDPGWPDGVLGPQTRRAIRAFEADYSLPDTGTMTPGLVYALGLAAYATELGVMEFADVRMLAPPPGAERFAVSTNAAVDTDVGAVPQQSTRRQPPLEQAPARQAPAASGRTQPDLQPVFRVRDFHPLLPDSASAGGVSRSAAGQSHAGGNTDRASNAGAGQQPEPQSRPVVGSVKSVARDVGRSQGTASQIPPVEDRYAPRNWLIRDFEAGGLASGPAFGVFLEEGGKVAGPRFAERLRWEADGARFTMIYRNGIGQEVRRTGVLNGLNRIDGEAAGPGGKTWRWVAEAKPL